MKCVSVFVCASVCISMSVGNSAGISVSVFKKINAGQV